MCVMKRIATARQLGRKIPRKVLEAFEIRPQELPETPEYLDDPETGPSAVIDPTLTPPWLDEPKPEPQHEPAPPTRPEPSNKPAEPIEDDGDGMPTLTSCAPGWYRRGDTFYPLGRGPFPSFGSSEPETETEPEPLVVATATGPAVQLTLF